MIVWCQPAVTDQGGGVLTKRWLRGKSKEILRQSII